MGTSTSTGTLTAGQSRTFNLAPASAVTLTLSPNVRVTITESPATVTATGLGGNATRVHEPRLPGSFTYGPYPMGGSVVVEVGSTSGSSVGWVETWALYGIASNGGVLQLSTLTNVLSKCWQGKVSSVVSGADYSNRVCTVLETHTDLVRIGILNSVAADLVGVKVAIASAPSMPAELASLATPAANGSGWKACALAADTVLAGTDANAVSITWTDWTACSTVDRTDGGTLPVLFVTIQLPSTVANRPAFNSTTSRAGWEAEGSAAAAPFGRPWKSRAQAVLAVDTPTDITSTTYATTGIPFVIQYIPRNAQGYTVHVVGDSLLEGIGATINGHGSVEIARAAVSSMDRPVEICCQAISAGTPTNWVSRQTPMIPAIKPELVLLALQSPNSWSGGTISNNPSTGNIQSMRQQVAKIRALARDTGSLVLGWAGLPMLRDASEAAGSGEDYDTTISHLNDYIDAFLSGGLPVVDTYTPAVGSTDADGQDRFIVGTSSDGLHRNDTGHTADAVPLMAVLRRIMF